MHLLRLLYAAAICLVSLQVGCSDGASKPKKNSNNGTQPYQNQNANIPPYSYQQQQPNPTSFQPGNFSQPNAGFNGNPGLFGGQGFVPNGSRFSVTSVLGLLGQLFGVGGNGTNSPFSFLIAEQDDSSDAVESGVAFFADSNCNYGITTMPSGQTAAYYADMCTAFPATEVGGLKINGHCQALPQSTAFQIICSFVSQAKTAD